MDPGQEKGSSPPFAILTNVPRTDEETKEIKRQRERAHFASLSAEQRNERNKRKRESYRRKKEMCMNIENENTMPDEPHQQEENNLGSGNEVVKIRATFDTPDVGCKQGLVEAHDIIEQDVTTQTYENMIKS
ncbi:uncharacterized protein LOC112901656 isoform X2 [Panicum hallii]|nr:uncharacterized protein LOC112901656 isoform X2 [Panicum hallii]